MEGWGDGDLDWCWVGSHGLRQAVVGRSDGLCGECESRCTESSCNVG